MKKLNLKIGGIREMLSKEQMKKVIGGDGYGYGGSQINCTVISYYSDGSSWTQTGACTGGYTLDQCKQNARNYADAMIGAGAYKTESQCV